MNKRLPSRRVLTKTPLHMELASTQKVRRLPMPGPGVKVRIPLHLLPAYLELYGLEPIDGQKCPPVGPPPVLLVKRTGKGTHEHK